MKEQRFAQRMEGAGSPCIAEVPLASAVLVAVMQRDPAIADQQYDWRPGVSTEPSSAE
jgi:hypothetical protein